MKTPDNEELLKRIEELEKKNENLLAVLGIIAERLNDGDYISANKVPVFLGLDNYGVGRISNLNFIRHEAITLKTKTKEEKLNESWEAAADEDANYGAALLFLVFLLIVVIAAIVGLVDLSVWALLKIL